MPAVCVHVKEDEDRAWVEVFSGKGLEGRIVCEACADGEEAVVVEVDEAWVEERRGRVSDARGVRGAPEVKVRASGLRFVHREVGIGMEVVAIAAMGGGWIGVAAGGEVVAIEAGVVRRVGAVELGEGERLWIEVCPEGRFAAIVEQRGRRGAVMEVASGRVTMELDRQDGCVEHHDFAVGFVRDEGRVRIVHATDWNRLDVSDAETGALRTARGPTSYVEGEARPAHYLDYFHGGISISPDGRWLVDDGWVWHPVGVLQVNDLRRWLREDVWETEDGARRLRAIDGLWDLGRCFVDARTLAVWGYGACDDAMIDAVQLFDLETARRVRWFAGPPRGQLAFDRYLFAFGAHGTSVWDVATGERLLDEPGLTPAAYHPAARRFVTVRDGGVLVESELVGG